MDNNRPVCEARVKHTFFSKMPDGSYFVPFKYDFRLFNRFLFPIKDPFVFQGFRKLLPGLSPQPLHRHLCSSFHAALVSGGVEKMKQFF